MMNLAKKYLNVKCFQLQYIFLRFEVKMWYFLLQMSFAANPTWCIFLHENVEINISAPCSLSHVCSFTPLAFKFILKNHDGKIC